MRGNLLGVRPYILLLMLCMTVVGCYYDTEETLYADPGCDTESVSYAEDIVPIMDDHCLVCHNEQDNFGNIALETHTDVLIYVENGRLIGSIRHDPGFSAMPQGQPKILDCNIEKIEAWIEDGAPNN